MNKIRKFYEERSKEIQTMASDIDLKKKGYAKQVNIIIHIILIGCLDR